MKTDSRANPSACLKTVRGPEEDEASQTTKTGGMERMVGLGETVGVQRAVSLMHLRFCGGASRRSRT